MTITTIDDSLQALRDEIEVLKETFGVATQPADDYARLNARWRLTRKEAQVLGVLFRRRGSVVSKEQIMLALYSDRAGDEPEIKIVDVFTCKLRNKIGEGLIETVWGHGYSLSAEGVRTVGEVLETPLHEIAVAEPVARIRVNRADVQVNALIRMLRGPVMARDIAEATKGSTHLAHTTMSMLRKAGRAKRVDSRKCADGRYRAIYTITERGRSYVREHAPGVLEVSA